MPTPDQWEALAAIWDQCEGDGLRPDHLSVIALEPSEPCLAIGTGQGLLTEGLRTRGLRHITSLDQSPAMALKARQRRGVDTVVARLPGLPFADSSFGIVVGATGVLEFGDPEGVRDMAEEIARVLRPGGVWVQGVFDAAGPMIEHGGRLGLYSEGAQHVGRIAKLWEFRDNRSAQSRFVSCWTGGHLSEAERQLDRSAGMLDSWFTLFELLAGERGSLLRSAAPSGICEIFDWSLTNYPGDSTFRDLTEKRFQLVSRHNFGEDHVSVVRLQKRAVNSDLERM